MHWDVEFTDEFESWWLTMSQSAQNSIAAIVGVLEKKGP